MKFLFLIVTLGVLLFADSEDKFKSEEHLYKADIPAVQAKEMQSKGVMIIDVRYESDFARAHVAGAVNIPIFMHQYGESVENPHFLEKVSYLVDDNYEKSIIIYCQKGIKSVYASNLLAKEGYENIYSIQGGFIKGWKKSGLPIVE